MSVLCIIPARGGSKRIPRKNVKEFAGRPMIAHSIVAAKDSGVFDRIIVSTDDSEVMDIARKWGADVPFIRPTELASDHAGTDEVIIHALRWMAEHHASPEYACCLYATAPFVRASDLARGLPLLRESGATSAFSVTTFPYPIFRALKLNESGHIEMIWPEHRLTRSQDLPEAWHDAGQFYWMNVEKYLKVGRLFARDTLPIKLPRYRVQDIDTPEDWDTAERLYRAYQCDDSGSVVKEGT
ncbi:MAG: pseudaminic acid cytidylyltransferase [Kiritimatiellae bacterium]|nr:pseudaminic acid cytidylyltransferase [Kiritimatiellia bacterium]MCO5060593.1 pseudaminic acid cytidylyltransferase [Kiritimatiellia bacterium]MCO5068222.1 pseudaminic acid cytidylyltransferase [Kiritimatiellia bacterium]